MMVFAAEVPVSPLVLFDAVTVKVFTGCPFPVKLEFRVRPLMLCPTGALTVNVSVSPFPPPCTSWLVTVSPLGAVMDSKSGTPLIVAESVSSESIGDAAASGRRGVALALGCVRACPGTLGDARRNPHRR